MGVLIDRLIAASIRHRVPVLGTTLILVAAGLWAFATLNTDAFPDLTPNQILVMTTVPGLSPVEVEQQVTYPMETAMLGLPRTTGVRSISKSGLSVVTVGFEDGVDLYFARNLVQQRMQSARGDLPDNAEPMMGPPSTAMGDVFEYLVEYADSGGGAAAATDTLALLALTNAQEYIVKPLLRTVAGVANVNSWGGMPLQFEVLVDPNKLAGYRLTLGDLEEALRNNNANFGGGYIEDRGDRLTLRGLGRVGDTTDIGLVVVVTRGATPIRIRDVARVTRGPGLRYGAVSRDGRGEAISATVQMLKGANGREVVARVLQRLDEIRPLLPGGMRIRPFYNQGEVVARTTRTVFRNLLEGGLLVVGVLFLFLRNIRASLLAASVIPLALLGAFLAMKGFGMTANLMSLGALDFGLLVDASIVLIENMVRRLYGAEAGNRRRLVQEAALEVARPVTFGVAIIVAVYAPVVALQGLERKMFIPMAFTVCAAVLVSLLLALTYVPAAASFLSGRWGTAPAQGVAAEEAGWFLWVRERYGRVLEHALLHPRYIASGALLLLVVALASVPFLGSEFMPKLDEGYLLIETRRIPSTSLAQGALVSAEVERTLLGFPQVRSVVTNLGRPQEATEAMALNQADVYVMFRPKEQWGGTSMDELIGRMDSALAEIPGLDYEFSAPMRMRLDEVISGVKTDLGVKIFGDSLPLLREEAEKVRGIVAQIRGAEDVSIGASDGAMQLELDIDRTAIGRYGLSIADVQEAVEMGVRGMPASEVIAGRQRFPIVVRLDASYRSTPEAVGQILLRAPAGGVVALSQVARIRVVEGPEVVEHEGGQRFVVVKANVRSRDLGGFASDVRRAIGAGVRFPSGYYVTYGGQFENQERATRRLSFIVPIVLLIIGGLLYASFGTVGHALIVMLNVPFALVGGVGALWVRGMHLNLSAAVGMIAVFGVAILNGLVLIASINHLRAAGRSLGAAVREGAALRLRPVLATATVASVGFLPMALSNSAGAEVQRPLATVVIGGIISSTLLTLLVLPTVYSWIEGRRGAKSPSVLVVLFLLLAFGAGRAEAQGLESLWYLRGEESIQAFLAHADQITIVAPQVFVMDSTGIIRGSVDARVVATARDKGVKLIPLVMNPGFDQPAIHRVLTNPAVRVAALHSLAELCRVNRFDGIQFDFENIHVSDRGAFTAFTRAAVDSVHHAGCSLSAAVVPRTGDDPGPGSYDRWMYDNWRGVYDYKALADTLDFISYMTYAQHTGGSPPGPVAGYPWMLAGLDYVLAQGVPPGKISLGLAGYSDWWYPSYDEKNGSRLRGSDIGYTRGRELLVSAGVTTTWDSVQMAPYAMWEAHGVFQHLWLEDARAFMAKRQLAVERGLRGYSVWLLGSEDPAVWAALRDAAPTHR